MLYCSADLSIHAPSPENPFECEFQSDLGCKFKAIDGVYHVYRDQESLDKDEDIEWPYPDLDTFLADHFLLFALMTDGPL